MGVDRTDFIMYGWKMPYKLYNKNGEKINLHDEKFESMICGFPGEEFTFISDGMCGEYNVFGYSVNIGGDKYEGWGYTEINVKTFDDQKLIDKYVELFYAQPATEPKLFIFSHFS